jgi:hypothetical protein
VATHGFLWQLQVLVGLVRTCAEGVQGKERVANDCTQLLLLLLLTRQ